MHGTLTGIKHHDTSPHLLPWQRQNLKISGPMQKGKAALPFLANLKPLRYHQAIKTDRLYALPQPSKIQRAPQGQCYTPGSAFAEGERPAQLPLNWLRPSHTPSF
jgi:hypothetical protein